MKIEKLGKYVNGVIQPNYGRCKECDGYIIEYLWERDGFNTARIITACENKPVCTNEEITIKRS